MIKHPAPTSKRPIKYLSRIFLALFECPISSKSLVASLPAGLEVEVFFSSLPCAALTKGRTCRCQNYIVSTRMFLEEVRDIVDLAMNNNPA